MLRTVLLISALGVLGACAAVPAEDTPRSLTLSWDLTPEHINKSVEVIEQGDIFFEWQATAPATHEATIGGRTVYLAAAETRFGNLYCNFDATGGLCYEDRNADGSLDRQWTAELLSRSPKSITLARQPSEISPVAFRTTSDKSHIVAKQKLGMLYNGPISGAIEDDGAFGTMFGELSLGWHDGKDADRDPTGLGWDPENALLFAILTSGAPEIAIKELGVRYTALKATIDGSLELEFQAIPMDGVTVSEKFDFDIEEREETPEDPEV